MASDTTQYQFTIEFWMPELTCSLAQILCNLPGCSGCWELSPHKHWCFSIKLSNASPVPPGFDMVCCMPESWGELGPRATRGLDRALLRGLAEWWSLCGMAETDPLVTIGFGIPELPVRVSGSCCCLRWMCCWTILFTYSRWCWWFGNDASSLSISPSPESSSTLTPRFIGPIIWPRDPTRVNTVWRICCRRSWFAVCGWPIIPAFGIDVGLAPFGGWVWPMLATAAAAALGIISNGCKSGSGADWVLPMSRWIVRPCPTRLGSPSCSCAWAALKACAAWAWYDARANIPPGLYKASRSLGSIGMCAAP